MPIAQPKPTRVTPKQNIYLKLLAEHPMRSIELAKKAGVRRAQANYALNNLRAKGLVTTEPTGMRGGSYFYSLSKPYEEMDITITNNRGRKEEVPDVEILYAAILRNGNMTGQGLKAQFHKVFPDRVVGNISNIIMTARQRKLCL
ncbi:MAG: winged helix DNA-binding protein [Deltaproteobacteria bacterium]|nr:winged helix DNA-binding protein [Deltaproteobacteria bacterium]